MSSFDQVVGLSAWELAAAKAHAAQITASRSRLQQFACTVANAVGDRIAKNVYLGKYEHNAVFDTVKLPWGYALEYVNPRMSRDQPSYNARLIDTEDVDEVTLLIEDIEAGWLDEIDKFAAAPSQAARNRILKQGRPSKAEFDDVELDDEGGDE